ncbi:MAG: OsmC family protein [Bacteroidetes bacterium]|nr:OsmC family protein [Bacteroidota bacterium]MBS1629617.1 OsmC family protein [Bacteroidota bacterium]
MTAKVSYESGLVTTSVHLRSGTIIQTDAPTDNGGTGSKFSPTDLVASALASCMLTLMALCAKGHDFALGHIECEVEKIMVPAPRRIGEVRIAMKLSGPHQYSDRERALLEHAALTCPVLESLHPDLKKSVQFIWP